MKGVKAHELHKMKYDEAKLCEHGDKTMLFTTGHSLTLALLKNGLYAVGKCSYKRVAPLMKAGKACGACSNPLPSGQRIKVGVGRGGPIFANAKSQRPTMSDLASRQCVRVLRFVFAVPILRLSAKSALTICVIGMHMLYNIKIPKCPRPI